MTVQNNNNSTQNHNNNKNKKRNKFTFVHLNVIYQDLLFVQVTGKKRIYPTHIGYPIYPRYVPDVCRKSDTYRVPDIVLAD